MPRYDFRCQGGHVQELTFPAPPPAEVRCPRCLHPSLRVFSKPYVPILDEYDKRYRRRRRPNAGDDLHREHDPTIPAARGHDTKRRKPL